MKINVLLEGAIGTGKTTALRTIPTNKKLFVIALEPGIEHILGDLPSDRVHWHYLPPTQVSWSVFRDVTAQIGLMSAEAIKKAAGIKKNDYQQFLELVEFCADLTCDRTGESFGSMDALTDDWVVAIDGLTGLTKLATMFVVGAKPCLSWPEYEIAQNTIRGFLDICVGQTKCSFILTAHLERTVDPLTQMPILTVATLGKQLSPDIPKFFDEVVCTIRNGENYYWSTAEEGVDGKRRRLPYGDKLKPDFNLIFGEP